MLQLLLTCMQHKIARDFPTHFRKCGSQPKSDNSDRKRKKAKPGEHNRHFMQTRAGKAIFRHPSGTQYLHCVPEDQAKEEIVTGLLELVMKGRPTQVGLYSLIQKYIWEAPTKSTSQPRICQSGFSTFFPLVCCVF